MVASRVNVSGFSSLCEVTFIASTGKSLISWASGGAGRQGSSSGGGVDGSSAVAGGQGSALVSFGLLEDDFVLPMRPGWTAALSLDNRFGGSVVNDPMNNGSGDFKPEVLFDSNSRTCTEITLNGASVMVPSSSPAPAQSSSPTTESESSSSSGTSGAGSGDDVTTGAVVIKIDLGGGNYNIPFVQILGSTSGMNMTISVSSSGATSEIPCGDGSGGGNPIELQAWKADGVECPSDTTGDSLVIRLLPPVVGSLNYGMDQVVGLCEIWVVGLTQVG